MGIYKNLVELLSRYFDIGDSYTYNLTRSKTAFAVGTMTLEDFEEFDNDSVENLAEFLVENWSQIAVPCKSAAQLDLIDRKALIAEYDRVHQGPPGGARKLMEEAPRVDAELVVHERWIPIIDEPTQFRKYAMLSGYKCPLCGRYAGQEEPYCHCGARMDGGNYD